MPSKEYSIEKNGPKLLKLSWGPSWKNFKIIFDSTEIGVINGMKELKEGSSFVLPDNSILKIQMVKKFNLFELHILKDEKPIPGSGSDPIMRIKNVSIMGIIIGLAYAIVSLATEIFHSDSLIDAGFNPSSIIIGFAMAASGLIAIKKRSKAAILTIMILAVLNCIVIIFYSYRDAGKLNMYHFIVPMMFFTYIKNGLNAVGQINGVLKK